MAFCVYSLGFSGALLFDDLPNLVSNSALTLEGSVFDAWRVAALSSDSGAGGRPIAMLSFALNSVLSGGVSAYGLKLTNTLIHIATAWLVFVFARQLLQLNPRRYSDSKVRWAAFAATVIWVLHPLQVSTVLYAVQRMAQLSTFFVLLGLVVFVQYRQRWALVGASVGDVLAASLWLGIFTVVAVFSKENGILLPFFIVLIELIFFKGQWAGRPLVIRPPGTAMMFIAGLGLSLVVAYAVHDFVLAGYTIREFTLVERVLTQTRLLWHYLAWFVLPDLGAMGFHHDDIPLSRGLFEPLTTAFAIVAWLVVLSMACFIRRRYPFVIFGLLFFLVGHSLESGVLALEMSYEHRNYLSIVGMCISVSVGIVGIASRFQLNEGLLIAATGLVLLVLLAVRVSVWSDEERFNRVNLENHPNSAKTNFLYAESLWQSYHASLRGGAGNAQTQEQLKDQLISARYYFQRSWELDSRSIAALIMLDHIDSQYFPQLGQKENWFGKLEVLLEDRVLQAFDYNAIDALTRCIAEGGCHADHSRIMTIFSTLERRYPNSVALLGSYYTYRYGRGANLPELEAICEKALSLDPSNRAFLARLLSLRMRQGDVGAMYDVVARWMAADMQRKDLLRLKALFSN